MARVTFFQVATGGAKKQQIIRLAHQYFYDKKPLLFKLPDERSLEYVDMLLWRTPLDSFLPHVVTDSLCSDLIALTSSENNPNRARSVFNLTQSPIVSPFQMIYTFEDLTSDRQKSITERHYQAYKSLGYKIILNSA